MAGQRDVVVVGAGIAGLTAAYALRDRDVVVLEEGDRAGGRIWSEPRGENWLNFGRTSSAASRPRRGGCWRSSDAVWVGLFWQDEVVRIDPRSGAIVARVPVGAGGSGGWRQTRPACGSRAATPGR